jgi:hypothetical protein
LVITIPTTEHEGLHRGLDRGLDFDAASMGLRREFVSIGSATFMVRDANGNVKRSGRITDYQSHGGQDHVARSHFLSSRPGQERAAICDLWSVNLKAARITVENRVAVDKRLSRLSLSRIVLLLLRGADFSLVRALHLTLIV